MRRNRKQLGFTLIELMIVVAIVGILAVLAIFGVRKYLANAKTAEATGTIGQINQLAIAAYERESAAPELTLAGGNGSAVVHKLCTSATPVPATKAEVKNLKYTAKTETGKDYNSGSVTAGWKCVKFEMSQPQYYQYAYTGSGTAQLSYSTAPTIPTGAGWLAEALGDLNGDDKTSAFIAGGGLSAENQPVTFTQIVTVDPEE